MFRIGGFSWPEYPGTHLARDRGTPQGGVVSPLLMNLFLHYAFDVWMQRTLPHCPFARYADDAVVHCRSQQQAEDAMQAIAARLADCGLTMHPEKSKVVYCKGSNRVQTHSNTTFTFLGFTFSAKAARNGKGALFTSFLPGASKDAMRRMREAVRRWRLLQQTANTLADIAEQCNPVLRGWWNYYGAFYRTAMRKLFRYVDQKLQRWAERKHKTLRGRKRRSGEWLCKMKRCYPGLFVHWQWKVG